MSTFLEFKAGSGKKVIISVALLLIAAVITIYYYRGDSAGVGDSGIHLKCMECGHVKTISPEQFLQMTDNRNEWYIEKVAERNPELAEKMRQRKGKRTPPMAPPGARATASAALPSWGRPGRPFPCPNCGKDSLYIALKCPECGEVFLGFDENGKPNNKCPKCGYDPTMGK